MPFAAPLVLCGLALLRRLGPRWPLVLTPALMIQTLVFASVQRHDYRPVSYVDAADRRTSFKIFFYDDNNRGFDEAVDYLRTHADHASIVAAWAPQWVYLRTGLKAVMAPFERNAAEAERVLEGVPVDYLVVGKDVVGLERYTVPVVNSFRDRWKPTYATPTGEWTVYRRVGAERPVSIAISEASSPRSIDDTRPTRLGTDRR